MARICPHCAQSIDHINYSCYTSGRAWGSVSDNGDWDEADSGQDDTSGYEYECPECDHALRTSDCDGLTPSDWIAQSEDEDSDWTEPTTEPDIWTNAG